MFIYCVTCYCLTPLGNLSEVTQATGIHSDIIRADSEQDAVRIVKEGLKARFREGARVDVRENALGVLDENGHIINYFWNFRVHRV